MKNLMKKVMSFGLQFFCFIYLSFIFISLPGVLAQEKPTTSGFYINSFPQGATVHIENEIIGKTPCLFPYTLQGKYRLWAEKQGYEKWSKAILFSEDFPDTVYFKLHPKSRIKAISRSLIMPGWGQKYTGQKWKGRIFFSLEICTLLATVASHLNYTTKLNDYNKALEKYEKESRSYVKEKYAWSEVIKAHSDLKYSYKMRNTMIYIGIGIYTINLLDAIFSYPKSLKQIEIVGLQTSLNYSNELFSINIAKSF